MKEKPYLKIGDTYYPRQVKPDAGSNEVAGAGWKAWIEGARYYYEYDGGHFSSKFITIEISKEEYLAIRDDNIDYREFRKKYNI